MSALVNSCCIVVGDEDDEIAMRSFTMTRHALQCFFLTEVSLSAKL